MKEMIGYLRWVFSGLEIWHWLLIGSLSFNILSLALIGTEYTRVFNAIGMSLLLLVFFKWFFFDMIKHSWKQYKEHRNKLLTTIKDSHDR